MSSNSEEFQASQDQFPTVRHMMKAAHLSLCSKHKMPLVSHSSALTTSIQNRLEMFKSV